MSKKIARNFALFVAVTVLTTAGGRLLAQSSPTPTPPAPSTVTGGDPEPSGEDMFWLMVPVLTGLGV